VNGGHFDLDSATGSYDVCHHLSGPFDHLFPPASTIGLWKNLAEVLFTLIGKHTFEILYLISLHLNNMGYGRGVSWTPSLRAMGAYGDLETYFRGDRMYEKTLLRSHF